MAIENGEVLQNLNTQFQEVAGKINELQGQLNSLTETRVKLQGAIEVLSSIEEENNPAPAEEVPAVEEGAPETAVSEEVPE